MIQTIFDAKQKAAWNALHRLPKEIKDELIKAVEAMPVKKATQG